MGMTKRHWEDLSTRGFGETRDLAVCPECILDASLQDEVRSLLDSDACSFCGATTEGAAPIAASFDEFMRIILRALNRLYVTASEAGLVHDEGEWFGGRIYDSYDAVYAIAEQCVKDNVMEAIQAVIDPEEWTESHISESPLDRALGWAWEALCEKVKHQSRFVFLSSQEESSDHPDEFTTSELLQRLESIMFEYGVLSVVPAGTVFCRGRLTDDPTDLSKFNSAEQLGSPPRERAGSSRMSPAGISMFYGSEDLATVVAEIGAHSAKRYAIVGEFEAMRELHLVNLASLPDLPSIFAEEFDHRRYFELKFLTMFARDLAKPVSLDGREHIEYVPTQVVTEYLRYIPTWPVDGLLFRSAQNGGTNCVLFAGPSECSDDNPQAASGSRTGIIRLKCATVKAERIVASIVPKPWQV